jgi:prepilin-type N-terminal cleavage/methylation domain-containing protein
MKNFKFLKLSSGFSFVEILMALSILGIGILAFVNLSQKTSNDTRSADLNSVKLQFFNSFRQFLNSSVGCLEIKNSQSTITPDWSPLSLNTFQAGKKFKYFSIKEILAKKNNSYPMTLAGGSVQTSLEVKLVLEVFRDLKKNASVGSDGKSDEVFYFSMPVILSSAGKVLHCDLESAAGMACEGVGGSLDPSNRCKPSTNCKITGSYTVPAISSFPPLSGVLHINEVTNSSGCPPGSSRITTGSFLYQQQDPGSGKKSGSGPLNRQQITFYTCIECP